MAKSGKGSQAERDLCRRLSQWLTNGKADLVMWRSPGSGSVSTNANKKGKTPYGMSGDFTATHPYADKLLREVSIESKAGYHSSTIHDLLDMPVKNKTNIYAGFIAQCVREMEEGGKKSFWLIHKRDRREATITMPYAFMQKYFDLFGDFRPISFRFTYNDIKLISCKLDDFLSWFKPEMVFGEFKE